ncbi:MAG: hypothetical protein JWM98_2263 [Thermoleophilia bacterium]|nr:hypothetical protein [Thermoleophilia bacterium]
MAHRFAALPRAEQLARLRAAATARPELAWPADGDLAHARNAHRTNTPDELRRALLGDYDHLEADVRLRDDGVPVLAHDRGDTTGLTVDEWLEVGALSGRCLKLDFKDEGAIEPTLARAVALGIPASHVVVNVDVRTHRRVLDRVRELYPDACVNLSPGRRYGPLELWRLRRAAARVGPPVQFPLRWDLVRPRIVAHLRRHGRVAVWNNPSRAPEDLDVERARLRAIGVDGTIDLRRR